MCPERSMTSISNKFSRSTMTGDRIWSPTSRLLKVTHPKVVTVFTANLGSHLMRWVTCSVSIGMALETSIMVYISWPIHMFEKLNLRNIIKEAQCIHFQWSKQPYLVASEFAPSNTSFQILRIWFLLNLHSIKTVPRSIQNATVKQAWTSNIVSQMTQPWWLYQNNNKNWRCRRDVPSTRLNLPRCKLS